MIEALAEIFHVDMNYLLGYTDKIEKPADLIEAYRHAGAETQAATRAILHI